ncbi:PTS sugar transporter subunit IIC [Companilactobacillus alimentarius]|uniref:Permease IIC component n=1 Tax=Companilactobacillus alimentarius DSM 20249 TaxID=1423720 RepID=A0A2K9HLH4_9LACO|nr:PTS transporter subunit EIIC [Companilactobacillus alimentarius]AUI72836.1 PTS cellobiose transporter subunit IIC [Companilactobacillus alimentarius DSM 20249]MDT6952987.1 PTS transporter subunit EIIC [Companilactobacillus alimentarius]
MNSFNAFMEKHIIPFATKLNEQRHIAAIRDAFMYTFPITMAASLVILINNLIFSKQGFIAQILFLPKFFPHLEEAQKLLTSVTNGTMNILSIFIAYLVARNLAKYFKADDMLVGMTGIAVFMIMYSPSIVKGGITYLPTTYLGAQGLFVAMLCGGLVGEFLPRLTKIKKLQIKMPDMVPPAVARSFNGLIPIVFVIMVASILNYFVSLIAPGGINDVIYKSIQTPLTHIGVNLYGVIIIAIVQNLLWLVGIHGPNTLNALRSMIFTEADMSNQTYINLHGVVGVPHRVTWGILNDVFANMGGSGMTLGLIIAIFLVSRRKDYRAIAKLAFVPGLFNINEPLMFGLPIVLNPIMAIPFVLTPVVNILVGYFVTVVFNWIPSPAIGMTWTTPGPLMPFLGTGGNLLGLVIGFVCLGISVAMYFPFVLAANKMAIPDDEDTKKEEKEKIEKGANDEDINGTVEA